MLVFFFLRQNLNSLKLVQLFNWKQVNRLDSIGGSSFFDQIPSFQPPKWHFCENFCFDALFFFFFANFQIRSNQCNFLIRNGSTGRTPSEIHRFSANSAVSTSKMVFFGKFLLRWPFFFFAPEFRFRQISATFRFKISQRKGLFQRINVFRLNSIVSAS